MIQFLRVSKKFASGSAALRDVSFKLERGDFAFLRGASGAGKSTLLKLIYREIEPTAGQILVNGRNVSSIPRKKVPYLRRSIGVVFQAGESTLMATTRLNLGSYPLSTIPIPPRPTTS